MINFLFRQFAMRNQNYGSGTLTSSEGNSPFNLYWYLFDTKSLPAGSSPRRELTDSEKCSLAPATSSLLSLHSSASALRAFGQSDRVYSLGWASESFLFQVRLSQGWILNFYLSRLKSENISVLYIIIISKIIDISMSIFTPLSIIGELT